MAKQQSEARGSTATRSGLVAPSTFGARIGAWIERAAGGLFLWPAVLVVLLLAVFPLLISAYLSLARLKFVRGGFEIR